jgi:hypothetical protein
MNKYIYSNLIMLDLLLVLPVSTKDCLSRIQILSTKDYLSRFLIQLYLYLSPHLLLILCALFTFTPFLNFCAQLLKPQTFLDGGSSKEQKKNTNIVGNLYT